MISMTIPIPPNLVKDILEALEDQRSSDAEILYDMAERLLRVKDRVMESRDLEDFEITRYALAVKFYKSPFVFQALIERWSASRIVRELY